MYFLVLLLHSWMRWVVIVAAALVFIRGARAVNGTTKFFTIALDIQLLLGLLLYAVLSPITQLAFRDMSAAMSVAGRRFWVVEHLAGMILAVAAAHVGRVRMRRATNDAARYQQGAIFVGVALVLILLSIPWPGLPYARPLFRF